MFSNRFSKKKRTAENAPSLGDASCETTVDVPTSPKQQQGKEGSDSLTAAESSSKGLECDGISNNETSIIAGSSTRAFCSDETSETDKTDQVDNASDNSDTDMVEERSYPRSLDNSLVLDGTMKLMHAKVILKDILEKGNKDMEESNKENSVDRAQIKSYRGQEMHQKQASGHCGINMNRFETEGFGQEMNQKQVERHLNTDAKRAEAKQDVMNNANTSQKKDHTSVNSSPKERKRASVEVRDKNKKKVKKKASRMALLNMSLSSDDEQLPEISNETKQKSKTKTRAEIKLAKSVGYVKSIPRKNASCTVTRAVDFSEDDKLLRNFKDQKSVDSSNSDSSACHTKSNDSIKSVERGIELNSKPSVSESSISCIEPNARPLTSSSTDQGKLNTKSSLSSHIGTDREPLVCASSLNCMESDDDLHLTLPDPSSTEEPNEAQSSSDENENEHELPTLSSLINPGIENTEDKSSLIRAAVEKVMKEKDTISSPVQAIAASEKESRELQSKDLAMLDNNANDLPDLSVCKAKKGLKRKVYGDDQGQKKQLKVMVTDCLKMSSQESTAVDAEKPVFKEDIRRKKQSKTADSLKLSSQESTSAGTGEKGCDLIQALTEKHESPKKNNESLPSSDKDGVEKKSKDVIVIEDDIEFRDEDFEDWFHESCIQEELCKEQQEEEDREIMEQIQMARYVCELLHFFLSSREKSL